MGRGRDPMALTWGWLGWLLEIFGRAGFEYNQIKTSEYPFSEPMMDVIGRFPTQRASNAWLSFLVCHGPNVSIRRFVIRNSPISNVDWGKALAINGRNNTIAGKASIMLPEIKSGHLGMQIFQPLVMEVFTLSTVLTQCRLLAQYYVVGLGGLWIRYWFVA